MTREDLHMFEKGLLQWGISLSEQQLNQFVQYGTILQEWNARMNLTAITDAKDIAIKHFLDSLSICGILQSREGKHVIDVGTGAGLPGIPLKIAFPTWRITLTDALQKRIHFLDEVVRALGLKDVQTIHARAEQLGHAPAHREQYDLCVSRAVAKLATLTEYCLPFVKVGGQFIAYKAKGVKEELLDAEYAVKQLGGKAGRVVSFSLSEDAQERSLICIEKEKVIPKKYPRAEGVPSKKPLKR